MRGIFCCDWPIYKDAEGNYYDITLTNKVLERYLNVVDELTILIRVEKLYDDSMISKLSKINLDRIKIIEMPNILSINGMIFEKKNVREKLKEIVSDIDMIFVRIPSMLGNELIKIANKMNKKYLVEVGGCAWDSYWNHSLKGKLMAPYFYIATKHAVYNASYATYVTSEFLQRRYPTKGKQCIASNVMINKTEETVLQKRIEKINNMNRNRPILIGTIAAVDVKYKGQEYVIKAISKLNKEGYNFEYHLVGKGDQTFLTNLAKKYGIEDKIKFLGIMKADDILKYLDNIDIYSQPSKQEGLPRALIEAMSRACPSIGSTTAGIPELLEKNMIFNNGNVGQIYHKLKNLNKEEMIKQAKINFEKVKEYEITVLDNRRNSFFKEYSDVIVKNKSN